MGTVVYILAVHGHHQLVKSRELRHYLCEIYPVALWYGQALNECKISSFLTQKVAPKQLLLPSGEVDEEDIYVEVEVDDGHFDGGFDPHLQNPFVSKSLAIVSRSLVSRLLTHSQKDRLLGKVLVLVCSAIMIEAHFHYSWLSCCVTDVHLELYWKVREYCEGALVGGGRPRLGGSFSRRVGLHRATRSRC